MAAFATVLRVALVLYHQLTTWGDFFPFNGARFHCLTAIVTFMAFPLAPFPFGQWCAGLIIGAFLICGTIYQFCFQGRQDSMRHRPDAAG